MPSPQLERGTPYPIRPAIAMFSLAVGPFSLPRDAAPVDWTVAGTKIALNAVTARAMDERTNYTIDTVNNKIDLRAGQYLIEMSIRVFNSDAVNNESARFAITNADGSTVYKEGLDVLVGASSRWNARLTHILHLTEPGSIVLRGAQVTDTGGADDIQIATQAEEFLMITRIGNQNEA